MNQSTLIIFTISIFMLLASCKDNEDNFKTNQMDNFEKEKIAILKILNEETKAAFSRDYEGWKNKWIHEDYVSKTYMNFADSTMTETLGWEAINDFVKTYIEEHPDPDPLPTPIDEIEVRLYGNGAWVEYEQVDPGRGLKRETRLMEKEEGQWKIAGMQTIIYGLAKKD